MRRTVAVGLALLAACSGSNFVPHRDGGSLDLAGAASDGKMASGDGGHYMGGPIPLDATQVGMEAGASLTVGDYGLYVTDSLSNGNATYRVVWTGQISGEALHHHFVGSIWSPGSIFSIVPGCTGGSCALEAGDFVSLPITVSEGLRIDFDTDAGDLLDGLEFSSSQAILYLYLEIDGAPSPSNIYYPAVGLGMMSCNGDPCELITS